MIRHKQRLVHRMVVEHLRDGLQQMDWITPPIIFAASPAVVIDYQPDERGNPIEPNTVAVTMGDEQPDVGEELGHRFGGLQSMSIPVFVDIYGEHQAISVALASDIKYLLKDLTVPLLDWNGVPTGATLDIDDVTGPERPQAANTMGAENFKRHWRVVKAMTTTYFQD